MEDGWGGRRTCCCCQLLRYFLRLVTQLSLLDRCRCILVITHCDDIVPLSRWTHSDGYFRCRAQAALSVFQHMFPWQYFSSRIELVNSYQLRPVPNFAFWTRSPQRGYFPSRGKSGTEQLFFGGFFSLKVRTRAHDFSRRRTGSRTLLSLHRHELCIIVSASTVL